MITLTRDAWKKFAPGCPQTWTDALFSSLTLLTENGLLDTELRWCHFAGTVYEETGNFKELRENLNYTTLGALQRAWPSRFGHMTAAQAKPFLRNPRALANKVYNGRMGNAVGSSDGYDFRGGGWIQTTGREAVETYCKQLGIEPSLTTLDDPMLTLKFAVLEWTAKNCNQWADENNIVKVAKAINTGSADSNVTPVGMDLRRAAFARAWKQWGEYGVADTPAKPVGVKEYGTLTTAAVVATQGAHEVANTTAQSFMSSGNVPTVSDLSKIVSTGQQVRGLTEQAGDLGHWLTHSSLAPVLILGILASLYFIWKDVGIGTSSKGGQNDSSSS